jgi:Transcription factor WhiB
MSILQEIGADEESYTWQDLAACRSLDTNIFFDRYEEDPVSAMAVDQMCLACPVAHFCIDFGVETKSDGVWGGVYLTRGEIDSKYNSHKSNAVWEQWREDIGIHS